MGQGAAQKMITLVNDILDVSRLESGRMPMDLAPVGLFGLVAHTLTGQSVLALDKNLHLENDVPMELPPAMADGTLIGRVLENLIGNAIKFTPNGGLIRVGAEVQVREEESAPELVVSVFDDGPPIPPGLQGRLFERFATGRGEASGSGLGLAFCKLAVEAHGGRIWAESDHPEGVTFSFTLPAAQ
jgi:signal transduction histidine kinase